ncbi:ribokinase [Azospirillum sp.]|uniref:ribokinase n=1 Tax=Azospirillum sp. TaxID=34012 RepID=UPI003D763033
MIVVFGSLNIDLVMAVPALPRPGETVLCPSYRALPGGKGNNQAVAAARAGGTVRMFGRVGADGFGTALRDNLVANGIADGDLRTAEAPTGCAAITVDPHGENAIAVASGANLEVRATDVPDAALIPGGFLVAQMEVPDEENWAVLRRAKAAGMRTVLNLAPAPAPTPALTAALRDTVDILVVNELEAAALAGGPNEGSASADAAALCCRLAESLRVVCVVTLGGRGVLACDGERVWSVGALPVTVVDTTGAGDTFTGALVAALDAGEPLPLALSWASTAAALACCGHGAQDSMPHAPQIRASRAKMPPVGELPVELVRHE